MIRRPALIVTLIVLGAFAALARIGTSILERDRDALYERYAEERTHGIEAAAHALAGDVADIGVDLDLAATLVADAESKQVAERELHAIATIKREYLVMDARTNEGTTRVIAFDAPPGTAELADRVLAEMLDVATTSPGTVQTSQSFSRGDQAATWFRVYARRPPNGGPTVAVVIDTRLLLARLKLQRDLNSRVLIENADGAIARSSDASLTTQFRRNPLAFAGLVAAARADRSNSQVIGIEAAAAIGLPDTPAIAIAVPLHVDSGAPWTLLVVTSTSDLATQERTLARRVIAGGALVLALLLSSAVYVVVNARRAAMFRERLRHVDRLAHLTEKAEKIIAHIPSGVLTLSKDRRVTGVNRWFHERSGRDAANQPMIEIFSGAPREDVEALERLVLLASETRSAQSIQRARLQLFGADASLTIHAIPLERGGPDVDLIVVFEDHTQLRRIEERLLHSEKLATAGQLAAGIAHEIGTPLGVARGRVEMSLSHLGADHAEADNHRIVMDQIDRVTRLLQSLLDYVRPTPPMIRDVGVAATMRVVADLLAAHASKRHVKLELEVTPELTVRADPDQLQQVLLNLTLNGIDACTDGGHVTIRATRDGKLVVFEVIDDGAGIPRELLTKVFDPFFTTKKRGQGTGLGLWVVAQLVRAHAGEIELESTLGSGTKMRVVWPTA